ncbi:MAG: glutamate--tRNA ligase [Zetaproteobacteria bacterium]|nr:glutamate--tRNA ligase [Zetaproteobacteria bacterium]
MSELQPVRVRIAPSPTGDPHVGTAYTTLFNFLFARQQQGKLILRIEDTDQKRARRDSEEMLFSTLKWLGLHWDEGPDVGGDYGPYRQSERKEIHQQYAQQLVQQDKAFYCFCSAERLQQVRDAQRAAGESPGYDGHCRHLTQDEVKSRLAAGESHVVRLKVTRPGQVTFEDGIRGPITIDLKQVDDQVLIKSDGFPTYHLANVIDDHLMKISHVIRAEEWISSTPKHVLLYQAFGWPLPKFYHLPLLRNKDQSKISKRKNPVSLNYYRRKGILPPAMLNFLALMGSSFAEDQEIFSVEEMTARFKLNKISLGGPIFDMVKLKHLNQHYIKAMGPRCFAAHVREEMYSQDFLEQIYPLFCERITAFEEFVDKTSFLYNGELDYRDLPIVPKKRTPLETKAAFEKLLEKVDQADVWDVEFVEQMLSGVQQELELKPRDFLMPVRIAVTGRKDSPPLPQSIVCVGKAMTRFRLAKACEFLAQLEVNPS